MNENIARFLLALALIAIVSVAFTFGCCVGRETERKSIKEFQWYLAYEEWIRGN